VSILGPRFHFSNLELNPPPLEGEGFLNGVRLQGGYSFPFLLFVIPAEAGIQNGVLKEKEHLDTRFRGYDESDRVTSKIDSCLFRLPFA